MFTNPIVVLLISCFGIILNLLVQSHQRDADEGLIRLVRIPVRALDWFLGDAVNHRAGLVFLLQKIDCRLILQRFVLELHFPR